MKYVGKIVRCSDPGARSAPDVVSQKKTGIGIGEATAFREPKANAPCLHGAACLPCEQAVPLVFPRSSIPQRRIFVTFDGATVAWYTRGLKHWCSGSNGSGLQGERRRAIHRKQAGMAIELPILIEATRVVGAAVDAKPAAEKPIKAACRNPRWERDIYVGLS